MNSISLDVLNSETIEPTTTLDFKHTALSGFDEFYKLKKYLSISALTAVARCPRRFFYSSGCRLTSPEEHCALKFGEAIHKAMPAITSISDLPTAERIHQAITDFESVWQGQIGDDVRNSAAAEDILCTIGSLPNNQRIYKQIRPPKPTIQLAESVSDWELPFAIAIPNLPIPLVGRIDGLCELNADGTLWGLERKTTRQMGGNFFSAFDLSPQVLGYTLALKTLIPNRPIRGMILEAISTAKTKRGETLAQPVFVQDHHLESFIAWAQYWGNMILEFEKHRDFPKWFTGCHPYSMFGAQGYACDYISLCKVPEWTMLKNSFVTKEEPKVVQLS
jgi:hypothetical protein